jgi:hypothetical protein
MKKLLILFSLLLLLSTGCGHVDVPTEKPTGPDVWQFDFWGDVTWTLHARLVENSISEKDLSAEITASTHGPGSFDVDYMRATVADGILSGEIKGYAVVQGGATWVNISFSGEISDTEGEGDWSAERIIGPAYGQWRCVSQQ